MRGQALWEFLCAGADSYWFESRGAPLADAANQLLAGGAVMSREIAQRVLDYFAGAAAASPLPMHATWQAGAPDPADNPLSLLSAERALLVLLAQGRSIDEVADMQCVKPRALAERTHAVYRKLQWSKRINQLSLAA